ncbi:hypothetical protein [uncultured Prevotella sp.]|uniref:hypothetical protein n=1 Tax=uncultured Prevotella sp. TaxID=159272 RepID=UPI00262D7446|nr:hypothetical protein [uncultured Prevotella sp.]
MKKVLYFIAIAIVLGFTACSEDKCDHITDFSPEATISVVGNWYNEAANEECRYSADGTFYNKYNNVEISGEKEGRWEYDKANSKLSWRYVSMGQNQFNDWKVKNLTDFSLTISSNEKGEFTYEKIVETYKLEVGKTAYIKFAIDNPDNVVSSYVSSNPRLATVNSDGVITAEGEKGSAYIKIQTNQGNVWVKVVVGDDCQDLWYDYVSVIGQDYSSMISTLSSLGKPYTGDDGYSFGFKQTHHDVVDITKVYLCQEDGLVEEIQLVLKESVPEAAVLAYMNSHYYSMAEDESLVYYSTLKDKDASKAIVAYDKEKKVVCFKETKHYLQTEVNKFGLYYQCLGLTRNQIVNKYGNPFSDENGTMYYGVYTDYVNLAAFRFDSTTKKCSIVLTTINEAISTDVVLNSFNKKYVVFEKGTLADGSQYAWINGATFEESTLGIIYKPNDKMIIYQPLNGTAKAKMNSMSRAMNNQEMKRIAHVK